MDLLNYKLSKDKKMETERIFLFIGFDKDYYDCCFGLVKNSPNFIFLDTTIGNGVFAKLQKIHVSERTNKYYEIPFKELWMNKFEKYICDPNKTVVFVFSKSLSWLIGYKNGIYIDCLREAYKNSIIVLYLADRISSYIKFDLTLFKSKCDAVLTYNETDAKNYGITYVPLPYHPYEFYMDHSSSTSHFDILYCGRAKERLADIYSAYDYFTQRGFTCCFYLTGVEKKKRREEKGIKYKTVDYREYLKMVKNSYALLEITDSNIVGESLRVKEALWYGKVLISNNKNICDKYSYLNNQIFLYSDGIDTLLLKNNLGIQFDSREDKTFYEYLNDMCERD